MLLMYWNAFNYDTQETMSYKYEHSSQQHQSLDNEDTIHPAQSSSDCSQPDSINNFCSLLSYNPSLFASSTSAMRLMMMTMSMSRVPLNSAPRFAAVG